MMSIYSCKEENCKKIASTTQHSTTRKRRVMSGARLGENGRFPYAMIRSLEGDLPGRQIEAHLSHGRRLAPHLVWLRPPIRIALGNPHLSLACSRHHSAFSSLSQSPKKTTPNVFNYQPTSLNILVKIYMHVSTSAQITPCQTPNIMLL